MPDYDSGFKIAAHVSGRDLATLGNVIVDEWQPRGGEVQTTERLADRVFRARRGREQFLVYMEAYTRWQASAPWSILAKSGLLSERDRLPTVSLVYVLTRRGYRPQNGTFRLETTQTGGTQQVWYREICLWEQQPQSWWQTAPGLMTLYPLCQHSQSAADALRYAAGAISEQVTDRSMRADLLTTLGIFGRLSHPRLDVVRLIGREQMKESTLYQEILAEGRAEGQLEGRRNAVREALEIRFGAEAAEELAVGLATITDIERLAQLLQVAIRCRRPADFRRALTTP